MHRLSARPKDGRFLRNYVVPVILVAVAISAALLAPLLWSRSEADRIALERQQRLVELVVSKLQSSIAHDQESSTVWDDAVVNVSKPERDQEWIDLNMGGWMHTYFGHDGTFILDPRNRPVFSSLNGEIVNDDAYTALLGTVGPMVIELRERLRRGDATGLGDRVLTPGASDLGMFLGHPAIFSVKPIVSDSGEIVQTPGEEYLHVAIRLLDGTLVDELTAEYQFDGLRFARSDTLAPGDANVALRSSNGDVLGYFIWRPYRPGTAMFKLIAPTLAGAMIIVVMLLVVLLIAIRRRSDKLLMSEAAIRHMALHDGLTGLPNRTQLDDVLEREMRRVRHRMSELSVLCLDLDRFKQVNDTLGHAAGDELIVQFAERLKALMKPGDLVARVGGDEFTIVMPNTANREELAAFCTQIIDTVRRPFTIDGSQVFIGVSIGVACAPADGLARHELTRKADIALYNAKTLGRSRYAMFKDGMDETIQKRRTIERDLREALLTDDQIEVHYQPLYSAGAREIVGAEALLRWKHPDIGNVPPDVFIPVAEESGLIERLGELVLNEACAAASSWPGGLVAVNVSAIELRNPGYAAKVAGTLLLTGLQPGRLELEVTESALTDNSGAYQQNIAALRELGVRIALDDFGTGFSSLGRLQQLEVDRIKIDRSFVNGFGKSGSDEAIVQAIVDLARAVGLKTTAEGVETSEQERFLREVGCDDLQGYLLSRPIPRAEMEKLLGLVEKRRSAAS